MIVPGFGAGADVGARGGVGSMLLPCVEIMMRVKETSKNNVTPLNFIFRKCIMVLVSMLWWCFDSYSKQKIYSGWIIQIQHVISY